MHLVPLIIEYIKKQEEGPEMVRPDKGAGRGEPKIEDKLKKLL